MNTKENRIAAFIESLPMEAQLGECQSALLTTDMDYMGGGVNEGTCHNASKDCDYATNSDVCTNEDGYCLNTRNSGNCSNRPPKPNKPH